MPDNPTPIRIGLLGCGGIARVVHLPLLRRIRGARITALADADASRLAEARPHAPEARYVADFQPVVEMPEVDAVVIALPPAVHAAAAIAALAHGKHVYLEKPLATTLPEGRQVIEARREAGAGLIAMMGFNYRRNPLVSRARELLAAGRIGAPLAARTVFSSRGRDEPDWKHARASGGGVLLDLGVHHIDLIRFLLSAEVTDVAARLRSVRAENDTAELQMRLTNGATAQSFWSLAAVEEDRIEVYGTEGKLTLDRYGSLGIELAPSTARGALGSTLSRVIREWSALPYAFRRRREPLNEPSFRAALEAFIEAARTGERVAPDLLDGYRALAVIDAAESAARTGRVVAVEEAPAARSTPDTMVRAAEF
jgi:predicted dehydrogenase